MSEPTHDDMLRELIRSRLKEIVRKKPGGGGYVLFAPNKGKKKNAKPAGTFPTKLGAKRAELSRFPPQDPQKLARLRRSIERLMKDPKKRAEAERKEREKGTQKESVEVQSEAVLRTVVKALVLEALFHEERSGSEWDEHLSKISKQAVSGDKKLQAYQRTIEKKTEQVLNDAFATISRAVKSVAKLKSHGVKHSSERGKTYLTFEADMDGVSVGPIFVYSDHGVPKVEVSGEARAAMTKAEPESVRKFRGELINVQERVLDGVEDVVKATAARDKYLMKTEDDVDSFVAGLTPLQVSILKNLLTVKYRKNF